MTETPAKARDYSETLFLPKTGFPMRAGLPQKEPAILQRWHEARPVPAAARRRRGPAALHPPRRPAYANGNIHIGHALNKILKDVVTRSQQMLGFNWTRTGLGLPRPADRMEDRGGQLPGQGQAEAGFVEPGSARRFPQGMPPISPQHWIDVQRGEFERLGVVGDWAHPYTTMDFAAETQIARELMKFAANGTLYRGSKPVMWSVVEKTALAEAEVEYEDYTSDTVWVKFTVISGTGHALTGASVVIWTTTPWTIPGNRAISYSPKIEYELCRVVDAPSDNWAKPGDLLVLADKLAMDVFRQARVTAFKRVQDVENRSTD